MGGFTSPETGRPLNKRPVGTSRVRVRKTTHQQIRRRKVTRAAWTEAGPPLRTGSFGRAEPGGGRREGGCGGRGCQTPPSNHPSHPVDHGGPPNTGREQNGLVDTTAFQKYSCPAGCGLRTQLGAGGQVHGAAGARDRPSRPLRVRRMQLRLSRAAEPRTPSEVT